MSEPTPAEVEVAQQVQVDGLNAHAQPASPGLLAVRLKAFTDARRTRQRGSMRRALIEIAAACITWANELPAPRDP